MEALYGMSWVVPVIIASVAACKIAYQVYRRRMHSGRSSRSEPPVRGSTTPSRGQEASDPMVYFANNPHGHGDCEYRFRYKYVYDTQLSSMTWRAYILRMPSLQSRSSDGHSTHRWSDSEGNHWICWDTPVRSLKDIQSVSKIWADHVQEYIVTGKRFG